MGLAMARRYALLMVLFGLLLCAGCGSASEVRLTLADNGREITLNVGQELVLELESNPTTGYSWEVADTTDEVLQLKGEPVFESSASGEVVGAGGVEIFRFAALQEGKAALWMIYHRSWEEGVDPLKTFSLQVVVQ